MQAESNDLVQQDAIPIDANNTILNSFLEHLNRYPPRKMIETSFDKLNQLLFNKPNNQSFTQEVLKFISKIKSDQAYRLKLSRLGPSGLVLSLGHYLNQNANNKTIHNYDTLLELMEQFLQTTAKYSIKKYADLKTLVKLCLIWPHTHQMDLDLHLQELITIASPDTSTEELLPLIQAGANVNQTTSYPIFNSTSTLRDLALLTISCRRNLAFAKMLLAYGADPNLSASTYPFTPLQFMLSHPLKTADTHYLKQLITMFSEANADLSFSINNQSQDSILHWLCQLPEFDQDLYAMIIKKYEHLHTQTNRYGNTPLNLMLLHCTNLTLANLQFMLQGDIKLNQNNAQGQSPLHLFFLSSLAANIEALELLLSKGADLSLLDQQQNNALHLFCANRLAFNFTMADFLLRHGVAINHINSEQRTPLHELCISGHLNLETAQFMLQQGADFTQVDKDQNNLLHLLAINLVFIDVKLLQFLLSQGVKLDQNNIYSHTALYTLCALKLITLELAEVMLQYQVKLTLQDEDGNTALHIFCMETLTRPIIDQDQFVSIIALMLQQGGKFILVTNTEGNTPLHLLCTSGQFYLEAALLMLSFGLDLNEKNQYGHNIIDLLSNNSSLSPEQKESYIRTLQNVRAAYLAAPLFFTIEHNNPVHLQELLDEGVNPNTEYQGQNILLTALLQEKPELALMILEHKLNDSYSFTALDQQQELFGTTALHIALSFGYYDLALLLLARGANPCLADNQGKTFLTIALNKGLISTDFATNWQEQFVLLAASGDLNAKNEWLEVLSVELAHGIATAAALTTVTPFLELTDQCLSPQDPYAYGGDSKTL